jgi:uncharacterized protein YbbC (DUF1343 family)
MKTRSGLDVLLSRFPRALAGRRLGVVCHNPSITRDYVHIVCALARRRDCRLSAIFGPQHGLFGQTQDNMVEWEGAEHPALHIPVYSLYGAARTPTAAMLANIDAMIIDLQDIGARPYTYAWTVKNCLDACAKSGIPVWVLDRPNPIGALAWDGPMLSPEFFSFVGGAQIPLCHRLTMGELAVLLKQAFFPSAELHVVWMTGWYRRSLWNDTGLPWVMPSPNMPTLDTAIVYAGMVLFEATNISEGRGTTRPFEIFGAPWLDVAKFRAGIDACKLPGCVFREHGFIPTFQKWHGEFCSGFQIHVTRPAAFKPVRTAVAIIRAIMATSHGFQFKPPPYEYETVKMPFDILAGSTALRSALESGASLQSMTDRWREEHAAFRPVFRAVARYPEAPR